ncbi:MAG: Crossover junction endodeoxyribonuclease RuvC [Parcubacteria group bacterium GW2011_GWA2_47_7]|nr:MAG: Crossover junction endodeoxyribonuclease RuvC [Parcubacteria group bacterium GW2011_GWA2_47_7]
MKVLAIDPGFGRCGVSILEGTGSEPSLLYSACIETKPKSNFPDRLLAVANEVIRLIETYTPDTISIEEIYFTNRPRSCNKG